MSWFHFDGKRKLERTAESSSRTFYTEGDILRQFRSENWSKLDTNSRLDVLNAYEQLRASRIGRKPAVIQQMQHIPANEGIAGKTLDGGRQIEIDLDMLSSYETLDTLIHESTHVEQFDACANNRTVNYSAESLNRFRAETVDYCADSPDYDRQCLELDANNCAAEFMMSKADVFADDPKYFSYLQERKAHFKNINRDLQDNETERRQLQERQVSNAYRFGRISEQQYQDNLKAVREQHPEEAVQDSLRMTDELNYTTEYVEENLCRRNASITEQMVQQAEQQHEQMTDSQQRNTISEKQYQILSRENQQQLENLQGHRQQLKELQQWQYDQLKEYVIENGMSRVNTENDEKYQQRYNKADMMSGDDIKYIQAALIEMNYTSLSVNGYYDLDTKDAVKRFQKNHGYSQTGVVDSEMAFNIDDALDKWRTKQNNIPELTDETAVNADLYPVPERKLYYNSEALLSGEDVKYVQAALIEMKYDGIAVTGTYDYETAAAVKRFQTNHNLTIDGIVGDQTTSALAKYLADWRNNH